MNDNLAIYGILFASDYDTDNDTLKKNILRILYTGFFIVNGKNSLYWETRDRNTSGR